MYTPLLKISTSSVFKTPPVLTETLYLIMTFFFFTKELHPRRLELKKRESEKSSQPCSQLATIFSHVRARAMGGADLLRMREGRSFNRTNTKTIDIRVTFTLISMLKQMMH